MEHKSREKTNVTHVYIHKHAFGQVKQIYVWKSIDGLGCC